MAKTYNNCRYGNTGGKYLQFLRIQDNGVLDG
jgi:hypothetical protein